MVGARLWVDKDKRQRPFHLQYPPPSDQPHPHETERPFLLASPFPFIAVLVVYLTGRSIESPSRPFGSAGRPAHRSGKAPRCATFRGVAGISLAYLTT